MPQHRSVVTGLISSLFIPLLLTITLSGCELGVSYSDQDERIDVSYFKQQCDDASSRLCFRVKEEGSSSDYETFENLNGFSSYQWGNDYTINVETSFDDSGDASSYRFLSEQTVTANTNAFSLTLYSQAGILSAENSDNTSWSLGGEISFSTTAEQGSDIDRAIAAGQVLQLEFTASDNVLTYSSLLCAAAEDDFAENCEGISNDDWTIRHFQSDCNYTEARLCLVYRADSSDDWELLQTTSSDISDFTPQWGQEYDIEVVKTLSAGGQLISARLEENDANPESFTGSSNNFLFVLNARDLADADSDNKIVLYDGGQTLFCDTLCDELAEAKDDEHMLLLDGYVEVVGAGSNSDDQNSTDGQSNPEVEIIVSAIVCNENIGSDFDDCVADEDDIDWWPAGDSTN
ncbi:hypothetical protein [Bacterioplanoides sp.]|uniref:hypothetical protein n=1 Tax=Bacterioplanoides sp. TaxID=2066072 RepID=UPI003B00455A